MPEYRRMKVPGSTLFLTLVTFERRPVFAQPAAVNLLRRAVASVQQERPFGIAGAVVLPDHVHLLCELPEDDSDFSKRIGQLKARFTKLLGTPDGARSPVCRSRQRHRERIIWQRRFWEHTIRDENDFGIHLDYIHYNPVKHGLVACPHAWPHSSLHRWIREGIYEANWYCVCQRRPAAVPSFDRIADNVGE